MQRHIKRAKVKFLSHPIHQKKSLLLLIVLGVIVGTIMIAFHVQTMVTNRTDLHFETDTKKITEQLVGGIENYNALLYAGRGLVTSSDNVTNAEWQNFFKIQATESRYPGISSIYYISVIPEAQRSAFEDEMRADPYFGPSFRIQQASSEYGEYGVARLVYSNNDIRSTTGLDTFSSPGRRQTYKESEAKNQPQASEPLVFATGPLGFFVALPVYNEGSQADGFVGIAFRADDFVRAISEESYDNIAIKITDVTDPNKPVNLHTSPDWETTPDEVQRTERIDFAGRTWEVTYKSRRAYDYARLNRDLPRLILIIGGLAVIVILLGHSAIKRKGTDLKEEN